MQRVETGIKKLIKEKQQIEARQAMRFEHRKGGGLYKEATH